MFERTSSPCRTPSVPRGSAPNAAPQAAQTSVPIAPSAISSLDLLDVRAQHLARRGDDLEALGLRGLDQLGRLVHGGRHRLVEVDVLPRRKRLLPLLVVQADRRGDRHRVHLPLRQQVLVLRRRARPRTSRPPPGPAPHRVADRPILTRSWTSSWARWGMIPRTAMLPAPTTPIFTMSAMHLILPRAPRPAPPSPRRPTLPSAGSRRLAGYRLRRGHARRRGRGRGKQPPGRSAPPRG